MSNWTSIVDKQHLDDIRFNTYYHIKYIDSDIREIAQIARYIEESAVILYRYKLSNNRD